MRVIPAAAEPPVARLIGWADTAARGMEVVAIAIIVVGAAVGTARFLRAVARTRGREAAYHAYRARVGRSILLGLEFLVAADIIRTVVVEPTLSRLGVLAGIVLIRTFLSFTLGVEINGRWPWQRTGADRPGRTSTGGPRAGSDSGSGPDAGRAASR